jgi:hypothetical protein
VGPIPYWEPVGGIFQAATLFVCMGISAIIVLLVGVIDFLWANRSVPKILPRNA